MTIWDLQLAISRRLLAWSALSGLTGAGLIVWGSPFWRGFGIQAVAWGLIDAAIALFGRRRMSRRRATLDSPEQRARESFKLWRLLWLNTGLDVLYIVGGLLLALTFGANDSAARGHGWGIVAQGIFLFFFDLIHARTLPRAGV